MSNRIQFRDFCNKIKKQRTKLIAIAFPLTVISMVVSGILILTILGRFSDFMLFGYIFGFTFIVSLMVSLIFKTQNKKILKMWKEFTGNFDI